MEDCFVPAVRRPVNEESAFGQNHRMHFKNGEIVFYWIDSLSYVYEEVTIDSDYSVRVRQIEKL